MATTQIKVFSFGKWVEMGAPKPYHVAIEMAAELRRLGVIVGLTR